MTYANFLKEKSIFPHILFSKFPINPLNSFAQIPIIPKNSFRPALPRSLRPFLRESFSSLFCLKFTLRIIPASIESTICPFPQHQFSTAPWTDIISYFCSIFVFTMIYIHYMLHFRHLSANILRKYLLCHPVHLHAVLTTDVFLLWVILPRTQYQHLPTRQYRPSKGRLMGHPSLQGCLTNLLSSTKKRDTTLCLAFSIPHLLFTTRGYSREFSSSAIKSAIAFCATN